MFSIIEANLGYGPLLNVQCTYILDIYTDDCLDIELQNASFLALTDCVEVM